MTSVKEGKERIEVPAGARKVFWVDTLVVVALKKATPSAPYTGPGPIFMSIDGGPGVRYWAIDVPESSQLICTREESPYPKGPWIVLETYGPVVVYK
jgi:hypothetical protein